MGVYYVKRTEDYLEHHGIKGQKWGQGKYYTPNGGRTEAGTKHQVELNRTYRGNSPRDGSSSKSERKGMSDETKAKLKKAAIITGAVAGTALAVYGAYKFSEATKDKAFQKYTDLGSEYVKGRTTKELDQLKSNADKFEAKAAEQRERASSAETAAKNKEYEYWEKKNEADSGGLSKKMQFNKEKDSLLSEVDASKRQAERAKEESKILNETARGQLAKYEKSKSEMDKIKGDYDEYAKTASKDFKSAFKEVYGSNRKGDAVKTANNLHDNYGKVKSYATYDQRLKTIKKNLKKGDRQATRKARVAHVVRTVKKVGEIGKKTVNAAKKTKSILDSTPDGVKSVAKTAVRTYATVKKTQTKMGATAAKYALKTAGNMAVKALRSR